MWNKLLNSPFVFVYILAGTILSTAIGYFVQNGILLPLLNIAVSYPVMFTLLSHSQRKRAVVTMLFWALCLGVVAVIASEYFPIRAGAAVIHGPAYVDEMFTWIRTGIGAEGNPSKFIPQHLLHLAIFCVLSLITASLLSLLMGAMLMNYMGFYVGSLIHASRNPLLASLMGWHPWSILRVGSFVILGVVLAEPLICKIQKRDYRPAGVGPYVWIAIGGLILDIVIKAWLAPWWGLELRKIL